jgi:uncharacterized protein YuzB (UPF0349 family)
MPIVEYCLRDADPGERDLLADSSLTDRAVPCLNSCGRCYEESVLRLDGRLCTGDGYAAILDRELDGEWSE